MEQLENIPIGTNTPSRTCSRLPRSNNNDQSLHSSASPRSAAVKQDDVRTPYVSTVYTAYGLLCSLGLLSGYDRKHSGQSIQEYIEMKMAHAEPAIGVSCSSAALLDRVGGGGDGSGGVGVAGGGGAAGDADGGGTAGNSAGGGVVQNGHNSTKRKADRTTKKRTPPAAVHATTDAGPIAATFGIGAAFYCVGDCGHHMNESQRNRMEEEQSIHPQESDARKDAHVSAGGASANGCGGAGVGDAIGVSCSSAVLSDRDGGGGDGGGGDGGGGMGVAGGDSTGGGGGGTGGGADGGGTAGISDGGGGGEVVQDGHNSTKMQASSKKRCQLENTSLPCTHKESNGKQNKNAKKKKQTMRAKVVASPKKIISPSYWDDTDTKNLELALLQQHPSTQAGHAPCITRTAHSISSQYALCIIVSN